MTGSLENLACDLSVEAILSVVSPPGRKTSRDSSWLPGNLSVDFFISRGSVESDQNSTAQPFSSCEQ